MRTRTLSLLSLAAAGAVALVLVGACATSGVNRGDFNIVSYEEEWALGRKLEGDIARQLRLVNDRSALSYLNGVGQRIVRQTELARLPWEFHLVSDPKVNAFNIPGGHVYVHTGLVATADNVGELAGVLAHEISHGVSRHSTEQLSRAYGLSAVASMALGKNPAAYQQLLAQILGAGTLARFSRSAELEADQLGVRYMQGAGYDPRGMVRIFQKLLDQRQRRPSSVERFFASHPLTEDRIAQVRREIAALPAARVASTDGGYDSFQRRVAGR